MSVPEAEMSSLRLPRKLILENYFAGRKLLL